jgi:1-acyl-sn-glycerol-3-phosphate acyltransferase
MWLIKNFVFSIFSVIIAVLTLIAYPVNFNGKIANLLMKIWTNAMLLLYSVRVNVIGRENITSSEGKVYVSNHASYLDIFVLLAKVPVNLRILYKREMNKIPLLGWAMMAAEFVPIDRENIRSAMKSLEKASRKMDKGISYVVFPEGTRSPDGEVKEFKRGMFLLAEKAEKDIIPISISNTRNLMPVDSLKIKSGNVDLVIGKPIKFKKDKELLDEIRNTVISNLKKNNTPLEKHLAENIK